MIIDHYREDYEAGDRFEKTALTKNMVQIIKDAGGRFLKRNESSLGWVEVSDDIARVKISQSFRTKKRLNISKSAVLGVLEPTRFTSLCSRDSKFIKVSQFDSDVESDATD